MNQSLKICLGYPKVKVLVDGSKGNDQTKVGICSIYLSQLVGKGNLGERNLHHG